MLVSPLVDLDAAGAQFFHFNSVLPQMMFIGAYRVAPNTLATLLASWAALILLIRAAAARTREHQRLEGELQAARTVQQLLLPQQAEAPGIVTETVYEPAQEVGGDFYFLNALADGALLVAVGDVSGKGLKAAMVVSMVMGALRNRKSDRPAAILAELNHVLCGQMDGGFVTCIVARVEADARASAASAGHLPPYLGGTELAVEQGLPLGVVDGADYAESAFRLEGPLLLLSDGVVEACDQKGELFGFERTRELSGKPARTIAEAARAWGQNDDITVVTVQSAA